MLAEHAHLAEQGAELVELRLDYITTREINLKRLLKDRPTPVIVSCRRPVDGGKWSKTEEERIVLLRTAIAEGVEYVDLEEDVAGDIPRFGKTKRIVSLHDFNKTPEDLPALHAKLAALDADIVKFSTMAHNPNDNVRMLEMIKNASVPTVGMCMGEIGTPSRILGAKFGAPFAYATFHHERTLAPGQLSYRQMTEIYQYENINADTEVFGVIADPIGHSLSPNIHNAAFQQMEMNRVYVPFRVSKESVKQFIADCPSMGIKGLSVTIPHKEAVLSMCSKVDGAVKGIGAANTLVFKDGQIIGHNTDYHAALDSLIESMKLDANAEQPMVGKTALLLGCGGVAKAIAFGLRRKGANVIVAARSEEKAKPLADQFGCRVVSWSSRHSMNADILVNCTPIGMHPNVDETPFEKHHLRPSMTVFDAVYNPEQTLLVKDARHKHCSVITGVDMFIRQAALQFKHFTGNEAPTDLMRDVLKRTIGPVKYLSSGKKNPDAS